MIKKYVTALITQSFALKKQSEHLLEVAKRAVEIAIEQDEAAAMRWIVEQTGEQTKAMIA
jgi:type I restriction enzyme S subunit